MKLVQALRSRDFNELRSYMWENYNLHPSFQDSSVLELTTDELSYFVVNVSLESSNDHHGYAGASLSFRIVDNDVTEAVGSIDIENRDISASSESNSVTSRAVTSTENGVSEREIGSYESTDLNDQNNTETESIIDCDTCKAVVKVVCSIGCNAGGGSICFALLPLYPFTFGQCLTIVGDICDVIRETGCEAGALTICLRAGYCP